MEPAALKSMVNTTGVEPTTKGGLKGMVTLVGVLRFSFSILFPKASMKVTSGLLTATTAEVKVPCGKTLTLRGSAEPDAWVTSTRCGLLKTVTLEPLVETRVSELMVSSKEMTRSAGASVKLTTAAVLPGGGGVTVPPGAEYPPHDIQRKAEVIVNSARARDCLRTSAGRNIVGRAPLGRLHDESSRMRKVRCQGDVARVQIVRDKVVTRRDGRQLRITRSSSTTTDPPKPTRLNGAPVAESVVTMKNSRSVCGYFLCERVYGQSCIVGHSSLFLLFVRRLRTPRSPATSFFFARDMYASLLPVSTPTSS